ncbi:MAG: hypothetical protein NTY09_01285 [bacterium]|nr:hypothetical protein [bacterium]
MRLKFGKLLSSESPSVAIFNYAYRRIWAGSAASFLEIFIWSIFALYLGFWCFKLVPYRVEYWLFLSAEVLIPGLTPFIIGIAIFKTHVNVGTADESLKSVPLKAIQVLGPRMLAVFLTWVRYMLPLVLIVVVSEISVINVDSAFYVNSLNSLIFQDPLLDKITSILYMHANLGKIILYKSEYFIKPWIFERYLLGIAQIIGWGLLPLTWGFLWASVFQRRGGIFILAFIAYLIFPAIIFLATYQIRSFTYSYYDIADNMKAYMLGLGGPVFSAILFLLTLLIWQKRS